MSGRIRGRVRRCDVEAAGIDSTRCRTNDACIAEEFSDLDQQSAGDLLLRRLRQKEKQHPDSNGREGSQPSDKNDCPRHSPTKPACTGQGEKWQPLVRASSNGCLCNPERVPWVHACLPFPIGLIAVGTEDRTTKWKYLRFLEGSNAFIAGLPRKLEQKCASHDAQVQTTESQRKAISSRETRLRDELTDISSQVKSPTRQAGWDVSRRCRIDGRIADFWPWRVGS